MALGEDVVLFGKSITRQIAVVFNQHRSRAFKRISNLIGMPT